MPKKPRGCLHLIGLLIGLGLVALVALKLIEDGRGNNAWDTYLAEQQALGVPVLWTDFIPPEIPDEDNFTTYPGLDFEAFAILNESNWPVRPSGLKGPAPWLKSLPVDFPDNAKGPQELLVFFEQHAELFETLTEASKRPNCRFDLDYSDYTLVNLPLNAIHDATKALTARGLAYLRTDQPAQALEDFHTLTRLIHHLDKAPSLVVAIVQIAQMEQTLQLLWEGLAEHAWNPTQLESILPTLVSWKPSQRVLAGIREDRAGMFAMMDQQVQEAGQVAFRGIAYQNMVTLGRLLDKHVLSPDGQPAQTLDIKGAAALDAEVGSLGKEIFGRFGSPYKMLAAMAIPTLSQISSRSLTLDAYLKLAKEAIKVELIYQREGNYPANHATEIPSISYKQKADGLPLLDLSENEPPLVWQYTPKP